MVLSRRVTALIVLIAGLGVGTSVLAFGKKDKHSLPASQMEESKRALHALNRWTFGPRARDVQRVLAMGLERWIDEQLHLEEADDDAVEARLAPFGALRMGVREIVGDRPLLR